MGNKNTKTSPLRKFSARVIQNYLVVWLDSNMDEDDEDYRNSITNLRAVSNTVNTFTDVEECTSFINDIKDKKAFVISSGTLGQIAVPIIHELPQVNTIYIFCRNKERHEQWTQQWPKVKSVFTDIRQICEALKIIAGECDQNTISISFIPLSDDGASKSLDQFDQFFTYTQVLKEILPIIDFEQEHFTAFITYCREQFKGNRAELRNVDKLEKEYRRQTPIWWYTYHCFLYSMLNCALRTIKVDLIIKLGFFIRDLHEHITQLHSEQYSRNDRFEPFTVYRGQGLSLTDFDQLRKTKDGFLSFNNFLFTSKIRQVSLDFAQQTANNAESVGILFVMTVNPSVQSTSFANIRYVGCYPGVEDTLFSMHSVFRIAEIKQIDGKDRLWEVDLILTDDQNPQLHALTQFIRDETFPDTKGWDRLGQLLIKLGQFDQAEQMYDALLDQTTNEHEEASINYQLGRIKNGQGEYAEAVTFFEETLEIQEKILPPNHPDLATSYENIGKVYYHMEEYQKALSFYEKTLEINEKCSSENHLDLSQYYSNIGMVHDKMGDYSKALSSYERALEIGQHSLPENHPQLQLYRDNVESMKKS